ncbi:DKNYY domain-containing protein [Fusobacterium simiae]
MKLSDLDNDFNFKKKKALNFSFIAKIISIIFIIFVLFLLISLFLSMGKGNSYEIETNGEKYKKSEFIKYQGKIYVSIPSGGLYVLENVDINTFKTLDTNYYKGVVGVDKNNVYFGNIIIPDLDPNKIYSVGNDYYSDGTNTYFCSPNSTINKDLSSFMEVMQTIMYSFSSDKKPQSYIYPYKKIETDKKLRAVEGFQFFATDGEKVYYEGEVLENADLNTLKNIDGYDEYFADKSNIYYKSKLLPIKNTGKLKIVSSQQGDKFLYDEENGYVFIENYSFDKEKAPYKVIGVDGGHLYNLIFVGKDGVYFYDNQEKKQKRIGDNIFIGNIEEINSNIFSDDENIYYLNAYEVWRHSRNAGTILDTRNTAIYYLDKKISWEKVADIQDGRIGAIWKKGNKYYYFDNLGIFQLINDTIYEISDKETIDYLLSDDIKNVVNTIGKLIENKKLIAINGEEKLTATVKYNSSFTFIIKYGRIILFSVIFIVAILSKLFKKYKEIKENRETKDNNYKW